MIFVNRVRYFFFYTYFLFTPMILKMLLKLTNFYFKFLSRKDKNSCFFRRTHEGYLTTLFGCFQFLFTLTAFFAAFYQVLRFGFFIFIFLIFHLPWQVLRIVVPVLYFALYQVLHFVLHQVLYQVIVLVHREC